MFNQRGSFVHRKFENFIKSAGASVEAVRLFFQRSFDIGNTTQEFELFIRCLFHCVSPDKTSADRQLPLINEICGQATNVLLMLLDDIARYYQCIEALHVMSLVLNSCR